MGGQGRSTHERRGQESRLPGTNRYDLLEDWSYGRCLSCHCWGGREGKVTFLIIYPLYQTFNWRRRGPFATVRGRCGGGGEQDKEESACLWPKVRILVTSPKPGGCGDQRVAALSHAEMRQIRVSDADKAANPIQLARNTGSQLSGVNKDACSL